MISLDIYPKFNERNYTQWIVCRYPNYILLVLSFQFICTYILHIYILIKKQDGKKSVPYHCSSLLLAPNSTFLPRVECKYFISCLVDMYSHTQSYALFGSPWWVSCQSLNDRPLPVDASVATTLCILLWGMHVIDSTVPLQQAFRHNILVHFPWHTGKLSSRRET